MLKLINTFLTCTGGVGKQWSIDRDKQRTITVWQHKGRTCASAMQDADLKKWGDEAKRRFTTIINRP